MTGYPLQCMPSVDVHSHRYILGNEIQCSPRSQEGRGSNLDRQTGTIRISSRINQEHQSIEDNPMSNRKTMNPTPIPAGFSCR
jgi:hypothetical protein